MRRKLNFMIFLLLPVLLFGSSEVKFDDYFLDSTMRVDFFITGDAKSEILTIDEIYQQGVWAGNKDRLIDPYIKGAYFIKVFDVATNKLIFSRGFDCIFSEYKTTNPAIAGVKRSYHHSALFPSPKRTVRFVVEMGDRQNVYRPVLVHKIDPASFDIRKEEAGGSVKLYKAVQNGNPNHSVDLVWLAEGYAAADFEKFKKDVDRYVKVLFSYEPYKSSRKKFNITGIFTPSAESGVDEPRQGKYIATAINSSFNAFHIDRYLLTEDNKAYRNLAAHAPYDAIVIMVNSSRYGGGGIYNFYGLSTVDHRLSEKVFVHEFGHSFAGLADEYYTSDVAYNEFYPPGVEPAEPNITALLDPENVKWSKYLAKDMSVPTEWGKVKVEKMQKEYRELLQTAKQFSGVEAEALQKKAAALREEITKTKEYYLELHKNKVGVFEGAGYSSEGLYRPEIECLMHSNAQNHFCTVCRAGIQDMIDFFTK